MITLYYWHSISSVLLSIQERLFTKMVQGVVTTFTILYIVIPRLFNSIFAIIPRPFVGKTVFVFYTGIKASPSVLYRSNETVVNLILSLKGASTMALPHATCGV